MPLQATSGAASYDAFGGGVPVVPQYIEDVFSTWLYTGNGSTQTITNGIDLAGKGGLVWGKRRNGVADNVLVDSARGIANTLVSNSTGAQNAIATAAIGSFNSNGFSFSGNSDINADPNTYASWTFRKQPKFFDVVTYTGTGANTTIAHNLGSVPACIMVKRTDTTSAWQVYHRLLANTEYLVLNTTAAKATGATRWNSTTPTSTVFSLGTDATVNASGGTYVAYIFAHDAGGFGLTGTDNVISCGSFTTDGSGNATVSLGYEPQWVLIKKSSAAGDWLLQDTMREMSQTNLVALTPNTADAENNFGSPYVVPTATGFNIINSYIGTSATAVYIAIRRGPMKVPTSGTSVFTPQEWTGNDATQSITTNFPVDFLIGKIKSGAPNGGSFVFDRLRGPTKQLNATSTGAEGTITSAIDFGNNTALALTGSSNINNLNSDTVGWIFRRAPSFFDEVCYTGTGSNTTQAHNLGVVPNLIIVKRRDVGAAWDTYASIFANSQYIVLNTTAGSTAGSTRWNNTTPTSSVFSIGTSTTTNASGGTYVAYLFATCAGVSKVGSYTGTATTLQVDCGFTSGARFILIKRTDSTGDWYIWDTSRGIVAGNDPYLLLNSVAGQVTSTDYVDTYSAGFELSSTAPAAINASGGNYLFLAIA